MDIKWSLEWKVERVHLCCMYMMFYSLYPIQGYPNVHFPIHPGGNYAQRLLLQDYLVPLEATHLST